MHLQSPTSQKTSRNPTAHTRTPQPRMKKREDDNIKTKKPPISHTRNKTHKTTDQDIKPEKCRHQIVSETEIKGRGIRSEGEGKKRDRRGKENQANNSDVNLYRSCRTLHGAKQMPPTPATRIQGDIPREMELTCHVNPDIEGERVRRTNKTERSKG